MLCGYYDDAGTHTESDVVAVGGLIGNVEQWEKSNGPGPSNWLTRFLATPPLRAFHLSHCNAGMGEFAKYTIGERDAITHDFRRILDCRLVATASMIDKKAYDELISDPLRAWLGEGVDPCVENCLAETIKVATARPDGDIIAIVLDRGMWTRRMKEITESYTLPLGSPRVASVGFAAAADVLPLQGADMVATENYWHGVKILQGGIGSEPRAHMRHYLRNMFAEGVMIDRARIIAMLPELERVFRETHPDLAQKSDS